MGRRQPHRHLWEEHSRWREQPRQRLESGMSSNRRKPDPVQGGDMGKRVEDEGGEEDGLDSIG